MVPPEPHHTLHVTHARLFLLVLLLICASSARSAAHVVQQFYGEVSATENRWSLKILFDADYAIPERRNDADSPQLLRQWLLDLPGEEQQKLLVEAELYLRKIIALENADGGISWRVSFPDFATDPPDFPSLLNDGAYFHVLIEPLEQDATGVLSLALAAGEHPNLVLKLPGAEADEFLQITPGGKAEIFGGSDRSGRGSAAWIAFIQGIFHVVPEGLDHILFILGIFLLERRWKPLLWQSLLFTAAHTLTLGLAAAGLVRMPASIVEPLIALSIAALAIENLFVKTAKPWRLALVFVFGLVHGLGFASVLSTWIRPGEGFLLTLFCANAGVEVAQVGVLAAAWLLTLRWHRGPAYPIFRRWSCVALAAAGLWWFVERVGWMM